MPPRKTSRIRDLPDQGSYGEPIGQIISEVGGPDIVAGHEDMLREHLKKEALQFTRNRKAIRQQDELNRGGRGRKWA